MSCPLLDSLESQSVEMDYIPEPEPDEPVLAVMEAGFWKIPKDE